MMTIETLSIAAPILAATVVGLFALVTNYFDDKAAAKRAVRAELSNHPAMPERQEMYAVRGAPMKTTLAFDLSRADDLRKVAEALTENIRRVEAAAAESSRRDAAYAAEDSRRGRITTSTSQQVIEASGKKRD